MNKALKQLNYIIEQLEYHYKMTERYNLVTQRIFTYEDKKYTSCLVCGHSDKAMIAELKKLRKIMKAKDE